MDVIFEHELLENRSYLMTKEKENIKNFEIYKSFKITYLFRRPKSGLNYFYGYFKTKLNGGPKNSDSE